MVNNIILKEWVIWIIIKFLKDNIVQIEVISQINANIQSK